MSAEQNKALVRQAFEEIMNQRNLSAIDEYVSPDFVEHEELPPEIPPGREAPRAIFGMMLDAFPDFKATFKHLIAEDDLVVIHMTWTGTQEGEFMGMPASGKHMSINVLDIIRIADGKFVEHWGVMDQAALMQQLGALPE